MSTPGGTSSTTPTTRFPTTTAPVRPKGPVTTGNGPGGSPVGAAGANGGLSAPVAAGTSAPTGSGAAGSGTSVAAGGVAGAGAAAAAGAATGAGTGPATSAGTGAATKALPKPRPRGRRVRLAVSRVDPWSAMKVSFLLSFAAGVGLVVTTMVLWMILSGMNVFSDIDGLVKSLQPNSGDPFTIMDYIGFPRVTSLAMVVAVVDVILLTALGTLGAYLYNLSASLVGGVQLTLTDD